MMCPVKPPLLLPSACLLLSGTSEAIEQPLGCQTYGELRQNQSVDGGDLRIGGRGYATGIGTHAVSEIPMRVPAGSARFHGKVGVDDAPGAGRGHVRFRILSGNAVLWESPSLKSGDAAVPFDIAVPSSRHRMIYLQCDDLGDNSYDHADWVDLGWTKEAPKAAGPENSARVLDGSVFGLVPNTTGDQSAAMSKAIQALRESPGATLRLTKGEYRFHAGGALKRHFHISNHDQPTWQPVSISLVDLHNVTIDGNGSLFLFHGIVQPLLIMDSDRITLRGIALDYSIPHHSQGIVTQVDAKSYEMEVDPEKYPHDIRDGWFVFKGEGWEAVDRGVGIVFDGRTGAIVAGTADYNFRGNLTTLSPGRYRVERNLMDSGIRKGDALTFRQGWQRPHPAVTIYRSRDTRLDNCPIHASHGMGILGQRSEDIRLTGGGVYPRKETGRHFSTGADATHFSNCKGSITAENGKYEGMMDDAINIHATCLRIEEISAPRTLRCRYMHGQSVGFETFLPGETLRFIRAKWLAPGEVAKVYNVRKISDTGLVITLAADIPAGIGAGDAVENADWFPEVVFRGNTVRHNRARGALFTTPRAVLVEGNTFESIAGSAILLAGDANGWYESGGCDGVVIRNNRFTDNLTSRFQFTEALISIYPEVPDLAAQRGFYHRDVRIEGNIFRTFDVPLVFAISTQKLLFAGNTVDYNANFPSWNKPPFVLRGCRQVRVSDNRVRRDGKTIGWSARDADSLMTEDVEVR